MNHETIWWSCFLLLLVLQLSAIIFNFFVFHISKRELKVCEDAQDIDYEYPSVMLVIPTYNDAKTIEESLDEVEKIDYPLLNVLIINDCSSDDTGMIVDRWISKRRHFNYKLVNLPTNSGTKAKALNRSFEHFDDGIVVITDGDTFLHRKSIKRLVSVKLSKGDQCSTVSGKILIRDADARDRVGIIQKYEHDYLYMYTKLFQSYFGAVVVSSGALILMTKEAIVKHGNFDDDVLVEDIVWSCGQITKFKKKSVYCHNAIAYTSPQPCTKSLLNQRVRWAYGLYEVLQKGYYCLPKSISDFIVFIKNILIFPKQAILLTLLFVIASGSVNFFYWFPLFFALVVAWYFQIVLLTRRSEFIDCPKKSPVSIVIMIMMVRSLVVLANIKALAQIILRRPKSWQTR